MQQEYLAYLLFPAAAAGMELLLERNAFLDCMHHVFLRVCNV